MSSSVARRLVGVECHAVADGELSPKRNEDVTASDIAAVVGLHPYKTLGQLHAEKSGLDVGSVDPESVVIRRGKALERVVADEVAKAHPNWKISKANEYLRMPKLRLGAHPDFYVTDENGSFGVLQTKTVASSVFRRNWSEDTPPFWISLQTATEMMLADADFGVIAALVIGDFTFDLMTYDVPRHAAAEKRIRDAAEKFWQHVATGVQPAIDYERDGPLLSVLFPRETKGKVLDLRSDNRIVELLEERERLRGYLDVTKDQLECVETEIKSKLTDAEAADVRGWRVTFKEQHRKEFTVKATSFRVLRCARETVE